MLQFRYMAMRWHALDNSRYEKETEVGREGGKEGEGERAGGPTWPPLATGVPRAGGGLPGRLSWLGRLPQGKVAGVLLVGCGKVSLTILCQQC